MTQLEGRVAVVTGAAQGIGRSSAMALSAEGARVVVADLTIERAQSTVDEILELGGEALAVGADVSREEDVKSMIEAATSRWGRLDILMNNAHSGQQDDTDIVSTSRETWDRVFGATLFGVVYGCKYGIPAMIASGGGSIINVSSNATEGGDYVRVAYGAAKAGVVKLSEYTATAYGKQGIRCNVLSPGVLVTPSVMGFPPAMRDLTQSWVPSPRMGTPEDAAGLVVYLASDAAQFINGQKIAVDGGLSTPMGLAVAMRQAGIY